MKFSELISFKKGRISVINATHTFESFQHNSTPLEIVDKMIAKTSLENKKILVIFNLEFLERLIHKCKINPDDIHFLADSKVEKLTAEKVYKVNSTMATEEEFKNKTFISRIPKMKFDLVFSNPPYNGNVDLKILQALKSVVNEMIVVHPSTWAIDKKLTFKLYNDFKKDLRLKSVELFNGNPIFKIGLSVPCMITHIDNNHINSNINVNFFGDEYKITSISDITKFGKEWMYIVKPFMNTIIEFVNINKSLWSERVDGNSTHTNKYYIQYADIMGTRDESSLTNYVKDDFYTMVMLNEERNKGIRKSTMKNTFEFDSIVEQCNFLNYCKTDFVRFCLALTKNNTHIESGETKLIPWMDFTQEWNDEKLFKFFDIDQETQDYIRNFLPDYYSIRTPNVEAV